MPSVRFILELKPGSVRRAAVLPAPSPRMLQRTGALGDAQCSSCKRRQTYGPNAMQSIRNRQKHQHTVHSALSFTFNHCNAPEFFYLQRRLFIFRSCSLLPPGRPSDGLRSHSPARAPWFIDGCVSVLFAWPGRLFWSPRCPGCRCRCCSSHPFPLLCAPIHRNRNRCPSSRRLHPAPSRVPLAARSSVALPISSGGSPAPSASFYDQERTRRRRRADAAFAAASASGAAASAAGCTYKARPKQRS